jgi:hypothetical protein
MTAAEVLAELKSYGNEQTKKTWLNHGAREPFFGVKIADMKKIIKRIKKDYQLALDLYATGNSDAMIHDHPNRLGGAMNNFVISVGSYVKPLSKTASDIGAKIGVIECDMGNTSCKVPFAPEYIKKAIARGSLKKKRKMVKC